MNLINISRTLAVFLFTQVTSASAQSWLKFYRLTNQAELAICADKLNAANELYHKAFALNNKSWTNESLLNSFHVAMAVRDSDFAKRQFKAYVSRGMPKKFFERRIVKFYHGFDSLRVEQWYSKFNDTSLFNLDFNKKAKKLYDDDQGVRSFLGTIGIGRRETDIDEVVDRRNQAILDQMLDALPPLDSVSLNVFNRLGGKNYLIVAYHYLQLLPRETDSVKFLRKLYEGLANYKTDPKYFAFLFEPWTVHRTIYLNDSIYVSEPLTFEAYGLNNKIFPPCMEDSYIRRLDSTRARFGLCCVRDILTKLQFTNSEKNDHRYGIIPEVGFALDVETEEDLARYVNQECLR